MTNAELADELDAEVKNERSGKVANLMMRASAALRQSSDIPLCAGHADWWFTSRNHLKGDTSCVVCAFSQPSSDKVLVPREPTRKMIDAGADAFFVHQGIAKHAPLVRLFADIYHAMLSAAEGHHE